MNKYDVVIKQIPSFMALCLRGTVQDYTHMKDLWNKIFKYINMYNNGEIKPYCCGIFYDHGYKKKNVDAEVVIPAFSPIPSNGKMKYKKVEGFKMAATIIHKGEYAKFYVSYGKLHKWIKDNGYKSCGAAREVYIKNKMDTKNPDEYITEIQIPILLNS